MAMAQARDLVHDSQYRKDPGMKRRVTALVDEMLITQDLVALRTERGVSQRQLAELAGMKQPMIARIEAGAVKNLELRTVARLAVALGARVKMTLEKTDVAAKPAKRKLARTA
jgi:DNA-binding Xre family transcriptional regulator